MNNKIPNSILLFLYIYSHITYLFAPQKHWCFEIQWRRKTDRYLQSEVFQNFYNYVDLIQSYAFDMSKTNLKICKASISRGND